MSLQDMSCDPDDLAGRGDPCDECTWLGHECPACRRAASERAIAMLPSGRMQDGDDLVLDSGEIPY